MIVRCCISKTVQGRHFFIVVAQSEEASGVCCNHSHVHRHSCVSDSRRLCGHRHRWWHLCTCWRIQQPGCQEDTQLNSRFYNLPFPTDGNDIVLLESCLHIKAQGNNYYMITAHTQNKKFPYSFMSKGSRANGGSRQSSRIWHLLSSVLLHELRCYIRLVAWHSGKNVGLGRRTFPSHTRPSADGWPLM